MDESSQSPAAARAISASDKRAALARVNERRAFTWLWEWARSFTTTVIVIVLVRTFLIDIFRIPSASMEGTLLVGDILFVNKLAYGAEVPFTKARLPALKAPHRGDVVVFEWPMDRSKTFVKRLVGLPGDTLAMRGGTLYVNGRAQREVFARREPAGHDSYGHEFDWLRRALLPAAHASAGAQPSRNTWGPLVVPGHSFFVLGDNRDNSSDSRYWGFVPDSLLRGQPLVVYYSVAPDSLRPGPWLRRIRWQRIGELVD
jgi:signal peptidase I